MNGTSINVLMVEDVEDDALLIIHELKRGGFEPNFQRVDTPEAMYDALVSKKWDIVIADHHMPQFSSRRAMRMLHEHDGNIPFIIVSGALGEEVGGEAMRAGAKDFLNKDNLSRLVPAVSRELKEAALRRSMAPGAAGLPDTGPYLAHCLEVIRLSGRLLAGAAATTVLNSILVVSSKGVSADSCAIASMDSARFTIDSGCGIAGNFVTKPISERETNSELDYVLTTGQPLVFEELADERRFVPSAFLSQFKSGVIMPPGSGSRSFFMALDVESRPYTDRQIDFIAAIAELARMIVHV